MPTFLSDTDRARGGARTYSRSDYADYLRKFEMPEFQSERETKYRFMTPESISQYAAGLNPRPATPGLPSTQEERDAQRWRELQSSQEGALAPGGSPAPGSVVAQLLQGTERRGAETKPPATLSPAAAPSAWGGTMRPLAIPKGTSLLEMKQMYGGVENDPVLAARREEYDRNLADYLRQVPTWQSREEYEGGLASLPGAGQEILGHIQQRAMENMPTTMRQEWEQKEAIRTATSKKLTEAAATEAAYQEFLKTATPDQVKAFHEDYQRTPEGWKPVRVTPLEKQIAAETAAGQRATPEQKKVWEKDYELTPEGKWRKKVSGGLETLNALIMNRPGVNGHGNNPFRGGTEEGPPPFDSAQGRPAEREKPPAESAAPMAARAYEGRTATNPQTGQKVVFRNGRWEPQ